MEVGTVCMRKWLCLALALVAMLSLCLTAAAEADPGDGALSKEEAEWLEGTVNQEVVEDRMYTIDDFAVTDGLPNTWLNILLLGTDSKYEVKYGQTDGIMLMSINLAARQVKLTSFMRDIWMTMAGGNDSGRLASACVKGGPTLTMRTINDAFGMNIEYYILVNLSSMAEIVDLLGGLDMDVNEAEFHALNKGLFDLSPISGMQQLDEYGSGVHLNGDQAVAYSRIRRIDSESQRTLRVYNLLTALANRLQQEDVGTIVSVLRSLMNCVETNLSTTQLMTIASVGMKMNLMDIPLYQIPAANTYKTGTVSGVWCIKADLGENKRKLLEYIYG